MKFSLSPFIVVFAALSVATVTAAVPPSVWAREKRPDETDTCLQAPPPVPEEVPVHTGGQPPRERLSLWYRQPARNWVTQALPIGNGDMGAMIFGGIAQDRIQFNHKTLWKGSDGADDLGSYLAFGDIYVTDRNARAVSGYVRSLNLKEGTVQVEYASEGCAYRREYLASCPDSVIAVRYAAGGKELIHVALQFINAQGERAVYSPEGAIFGGTLGNGMCYRAELRVQPTGGTVTADRTGIVVEGARELTLYLACTTDFDPQREGHLAGNPQALSRSLKAVLDRAGRRGYEEIRRRHTADYTALFGRVAFDLPAASHTMPTDRLLRQSESPEARAMTDMLIFQYARYLTIASSRGIAVPSNLQGIWNQDGNATSGAVWASDIHSNINVQMNYWPVEPLNLSECHLPFLQYMYNEATRESGAWQRNARSLGADQGWVVNTAGNIFGGSSGYKAGVYSVANAWYCTHLWQHFAYTRDTVWLRDKAWPLMKSACEFWFGRLVPAQNGDGTLECPREYSPEQGRVQNATAHAQQLVTALFEQTEAALRVLGDAAECDAAFRSRLAEKRGKTDRGLRIGRDGMLREWKYQENTPNQPADRNHFADDEANVWQCHRHTSHLVALYPGFGIDPGIDAGVFRAAVASLDDRGDVSTGWARAWRIALWARARNRERAYATLRGFAHHTANQGYDWHGGLYDNMLDAHATRVFQIEGNFGAAAGMAEMLLQSRPDSLVILPALPDAWADGRVRGLKAIGNFEIDMEWAAGKLRVLHVRSLAGMPLVLAYPGVERARVCAGTSRRVQRSKAGRNRLRFDTVVGETYTVSVPAD